MSLTYLVKDGREEHLHTKLLTLKSPRFMCCIFYFFRVSFFRLLLLTSIMHGLNYLLLVRSFWLILVSS